jgi:hypothetical protein
MAPQGPRSRAGLMYIVAGLLSAIAVAIWALWRVAFGG